LRGVESQGMLLAASDADGQLALVIPEHCLRSGATVK
jgi:tRNA-binding EMAP/Myf-like protein